MTTTTPAAGAPAKAAHDLATAKLAISITVMLAAYAVSLMLHYTLSLGQAELLFLLPVLAITIAFGLWHGVGAGLGAVVALLFEPTPLGMDPAHIPIVALFYISLVWSTGLYADTIRWRRRVSDDYFEGRRALAPDPIGRGASKSLNKRLFEGETDRHGYVVVQVLAAAATNCLIVGAAAVASNIGAPPGGPLVTFVLLVPVLAGAAMYGTPIGLIAALAATVAQHWLLAAVQPLSGPSILEVAATFLIFASAGACVGTFADRARNERKAILRLFATGSLLSFSGSEDQIWKLVFDAAVAVDRQMSVRLTDEHGQVRHEALLRGAPPLAAPDKIGVGTTSLGPWRSRRLFVEERDLGTISWHTLGVSREERATIDHIVSSIADLGASAATRARLNTEKAEMEFIARTEQLRTLLLDAVSHHFRTPLASILGSVTNLLASQSSTAPEREFLLIIKEQGNRLARYVENFLGVARLESGSIDMRPQPVDLEPLLYDTWESFGEAGGARRFLEVQIEDRPIRGDVAALKQVLGNLLENAIKFSQEDSIVSVEGRVEGDSMVIEVSDQGAGIPPADVPKIFGRFYRSREAKVSGMGLGLYICKSLVELMGGEIEALNRTDGVRGAMMRVRLPLAR